MADSKIYVSDNRLSYLLTKLKAVLDSKYKTTVHTLYVRDNSGVIYGFNPGSSDAVWFADSAVKENGRNLITSGAVYTAVSAKQDKLTFDTIPTDGSTNPVTSGGIFTAIKDIKGVKFEVVTTLPTTGEEGIIYLVPKTSASTSDVYTEYIWIYNEETETGKYEIIGTTEIELDDYLNKDNEITEARVDEIFAANFPS